MAGLGCATPICATLFLLITLMLGASFCSFRWAKEAAIVSCSRGVGSYCLAGSFDMRASSSRRRLFERWRTTRRLAPNRPLMTLMI